MTGLSLVDIEYCTQIVAYASTMTNSSEKTSSFYDQLDRKLCAFSSTDKIVLFRDFNARVSQSHDTWPKVLSKFGTGKAYTCGTLMLSICTEHQLVITNTHVKHKQICGGWGWRSRAKGKAVLPFDIWLHILVILFYPHVG